ncbi:hypothetical protein FACS1894216_09650 [Synergistales bacterium]|nr:hypothetical protein FACS1894216_09650 [Synergistales bacterium]
MVVKNLDELRKIKDKAREEQTSRHENSTQIIVGMGTCGIAAGARVVMTAIMDEIAKRGLKDISIMQTGCIGMCQKEPLVDVVRPNDPRVTYGNVEPGDVPEIISEHIVNGRIVNRLVIAKNSM